MIVPDEVFSNIQARVEKEFSGEDRETKEYYIKEELNAYQRFIKIDFQDIEDDVREIIKKRALDKENSWGRITRYVQQEIEGYLALKSVSEGKPPSIYFEIILSGTNGSIKRFQLEAALQLVREKVGDTGGYYSAFEAIEDKIVRERDRKQIEDRIDPIKDLLIELEDIVANECFNANIQNYDADGWAGEGRKFRYPVHFKDEGGILKEKKVPTDISSEVLMTGKYNFGANELNIYEALYKVVRHMERKYQIKL